MGIRTATARDDGLQLPLPITRPQPGTGRRATLADKLCALLERRGRPLEVGHVAAQVLRVRQAPERLQRLLVAEIVDGDPRLAWRGRDLVGLAPPGWALTRLEHATFCVVDLETTGGAPGHSKVTEIGAVRVSGLQVVGRFSTLVDPERPIPPPISGITGITDQMVRGMPLIDEALPRLIEFAGEDVLVAHNAPFDLRFLNYERHRLAGSYFTQPWLDTLVLARRLLRRRVERHDLGTLARWADTTVRPCHRALPDAEATAELLVTLVHMLVERGEDTLERAVAVGQPGGVRHSHKLALVEDLPARPGVYLMRDRRGGVLYVGKAVNLRRRVRSYFGPQGRHGRLIGHALEQLERVDHEVCGSEFEALLREDALIRELRPPCNRRGTGQAARRYLRLTSGDAWPRLYPVARPVTSAGDHFGPLRSERTARLATEALHLLLPLRTCRFACAPGAPPPGTRACAGPCRDADPAAYDRAVGRARAMLSGEPAAAAEALLAALGDAVRSGVHLDAHAREAVDALTGVMADLARLRRAAALSCVLVEPAAGGEGATAFFVAGGRVVDRADLPVTGSAARVADGLARIRAAWADDGPPPPDALEEIAIVHDRARERAGHPGLVPVVPGQAGPQVLAGVAAGVAAVLAEAPPAEEDEEAIGA